MSRFRKLTLWTGVAIAVIVIVPTLPVCERHKAIIVNNSASAVESVTLRLHDEWTNPVLWRGDLESREARHVRSPAKGTGRLELRGLYKEDRRRFEALSANITETPAPLELL